MGIISYFILFLSQKSKVSFSEDNYTYRYSTRYVEKRYDERVHVKRRKWRGEYRRRIVTSYVHYGVALAGT